MRHGLIRILAVLYVILAGGLLIALNSAPVEHFKADLRENYSYCHTDDKADEHQKEKDCKSLLYRAYEDPIAAFTLILTVATVALFVATYFLWRATRDLVKGADRTAERQLRAYISILRADVQVDVEGLAIRINCQISNSGQTPAYDTVCWANFIIADSGIFNYGDMKNGDSKSIIGPGGEISIFRQSYLSEVDKVDLFDGKKVILFWGRVRYKDIFERPRFFEFWAYSGNQFQIVRNSSLQLARVYPLYPDKRGYQAN